MIQRINLNDPESLSADLVAENAQWLRDRFPEALADGQLDIDALRASLGLATDQAEERFGLNWHGKRNARRLALTPSTGTLRPLTNHGLDSETSENLVIDGDNLEVLKLLQKAYSSKIKLIYIDPPYNTGKDFVYPDDYSDNLHNYLRLTGQTEDGARIDTNTDKSGRFHTNWLNMMYPRLRLARSLLHPDGVIFISIDQGELSNLKAICDEIFGEENFVELFSWVRTRTPAALSVKTKTVTEYVLCYERQRTARPLLGIEKPAQSANTLLNQPNAISVLEFPAGLATGIEDGVLEPGMYGSDSYSVELLEQTEVKAGQFIRPVRLKARFRWSQAYLEEQMANGVMVRISTRRLLPSYEKASYGREALPNLIDENVGVGTNENATTEIRELFGAAVFKYPKPISLLKYLIGSCTQENDIVLDFFAGSGTTGHAVWQKNLEDGHNRRFILVQLPEPIDPHDKEHDVAARYLQSHGLPLSIAALTRERLKLASGHMRARDSTPGRDWGFKAYRLDTSNIKAWNPVAKDIAASLLDHSTPIVEGRSKDDILSELLLKLGIPLTTRVESRDCGGKTVFNVANGVLIACLEAPIDPAETDAISGEIIRWRNENDAAVETCVVFLDSAFRDDVAKANLTLALEQAGIPRVISI